MIPSSLRWILQTPRLTREQQNDLLQKARSGSRPAADRLIRSLASIVLREAQSKAASSNLDIEDLFAEGLMAAHKSFSLNIDPSVGIVLRTMLAARSAMARMVKKTRTAKRQAQTISINDDNIFSKMIKEAIGDTDAILADDQIEIKELYDLILNALKKCDFNTRRTFDELYFNSTAEETTEKALAKKRRVSPQMISAQKLRGLVEIRRALGIPIPATWLRRTDYAAWLKAQKKPDP